MRRCQILNSWKRGEDLGHTLLPTVMVFFLPSTLYNGVKRSYCKRSHLIAAAGSTFYDASDKSLCPRLMHTDCSAASRLRSASVGAKRSRLPTRSVLNACHWHAAPSTGRTAPRNPPNTRNPLKCLILRHFATSSCPSGSRSTRRFRVSTNRRLTFVLCIIISTCSL